MKKPIHCISVDRDAQECPWGDWFVDPRSGETFDLSNVQVVHFGTDTVRQLYRGRLNPRVMALFEEGPGLVTFAGQRWHAGRIGRDSGYQYRLQNADLGIILLVKSFHVASEAEGPHLKIEVSPHLIRSQTPEALQALLDSYAAAVLTSAQPSQCAVHLAIDIQGWQPGPEFEAQLHCRSRRVRSYHGIDELDFASVAARYGRGESFLFGSANGLQMAVYNKSEEAKVRDKLDYWRAVWEESEVYESESPVFRIEFRFHHSIVQQFSEGSVDANGEAIGVSSYAGLYEHLTGLWRYGCDAFKYLHRPGLFHPLWTRISRQSLPLSAPEVHYRRHYKSATGFSGKNIELFLGNFISCAARHRMEAWDAWKALKTLPFWEHVTDHYKARDKSIRDLRRHIFKLLEERYIRWGRAV